MSGQPNRLEDPHPRGQLNGLLILSEIGGPGAWTNVYNGPRNAQFDLPGLINSSAGGAYGVALDEVNG